ncbi:MAG: DnaJ domain-containing protein [Actinomycetota bacterium]|nr:DnaJ domain-containing protein [Nitrospiraceae bacterium]MDA8157518.1 DnaJ domain-containing protein [Actinomycetota bacterium]
MSKRWQSLENRQFRRIRNRQGRPLRITVNKETAEAVLHDYSVLGAGIQADRKIRASVGQTVKISCESPDLQCEAEIVWIHGQKIGLSLDRQVEGSLLNFRVPDIFTGLCGAGETGILEFRKDQAVKKIYLQQGTIVFSSSNELEDSLGDMLLRDGKITREQYDKSAEILKGTGKKQGAILVELGALRPNDMVKAVYKQLEDICLSVFSFENGSFHFHDGPLPDNLIRLKLSAADLIYRGLKGTDAVQKTAFEEGLREDSVIAPFSYPLYLFQTLNLPPDDIKIISLADGGRKLRDILKESPFPKRKTLQTLYALLYAKTLGLEDEPDTSQQDAGDTKTFKAKGTFAGAEDVSGKSRENTGGAKTTARATYSGGNKERARAVNPEGTNGESTGSVNISPEGAAPNLPEEQVTRINDMHRMIEKYDFYEMLGLWDKKAEQAEIKKAYYKAAKEFHPDKNFDLPQELQDKLNVIFSGISLAYTTLSDPLKKINYDASLKPGASVKLAPDPKSASENFNQGRIYYSNKDFKKAEVFFALAMGLDAKKPEYLFYYGSTLRELGKNKEAIKILHRALALAKEDNDTLTELGLVYLNLGLPERAEFYLKQVLQKDPSNRKVIDTLLKIKKGV